MMRMRMLMMMMMRRRRRKLECFMQKDRPKTTSGAIFDHGHGSRPRVRVAFKAPSSSFSPRWSKSDARMRLPSFQVAITQSSTHSADSQGQNC